MFWNFCEIFVKYFDILWCGWSGGNHLRLRQIPLLWSFCCCCHTFFHTASTSAKITTRFGKKQNKLWIFCLNKIFLAQCVHTMSLNLTSLPCLHCSAHNYQKEAPRWDRLWKKAVQFIPSIHQIWHRSPQKVSTNLIIYRALIALCP